MKSQYWAMMLVAAWGILFASVAIGDDDERGGLFQRPPGVEPVTNRLYAEECGACHFAYQPGLLPSASWSKMMAGLDDHFGDNAELEPAVQDELTSYLVNNAADRAGARLSVKIARSVGNTAPLRITEVPYIRQDHRELPDRLVKGNPKVGSLSNCQACHTTAEKGIYEEHGINIPGHGRWDD